ncbi:o-succinylbenzoate synthase [Lactococcus garvieae]|uniref:o-succinylbenzoate synthase n=1 Tax=Lactococcus garvieae TaxID=1363 RepID=UPI0028915304|nr:o-succinylbenzoate synthase [Lactococcus garvieae]MDT2741774.1 o-succinylbenzoate synthase [Lactococcus garvieae]
MKLKSISLNHVQLPMKFNFKTAKGELKLRDTIIIIAEDEKGQRGYGECVSFTTPFYTQETFESSWESLVQTYIPKVMTTHFTHPFDIQQFFEQPLPMAMAGLENALVDLYYKSKDENTIAALFPETLTDTLSRGAVLGDVPFEQLPSKIDELVAQGVERIKLKIKPADGFERVQYAVKHYPHLQWAVDANRSYTLENIEVLTKLDQLGLVCIEEPFATDNLEDYKNILPQLSTPLCFDENVQSWSDLQALSQLKGKTMLNIKIGRLGGLYQTKEAIAFCRKNNISFWIGSMVESGISKILHTQLATLSDNAMPGDLSDSSYYFHEDLIVPEIKFIEGKMKRPRGKGLGVAINQTALEHYTVKKEIFT